MENRHGPGDWGGAEAEVSRVNAAYLHGEMEERRKAGESRSHMTVERFEGEVNDNARELHLCRHALSTGIIPDLNAPLRFAGRIIYSKMERRLHRRQVELQKSGVKPSMKSALVGHSGH